MHIVVSTPTFLPVMGGAELGIHEIYSRLGDRHDVTILTRPHPASVLGQYAADDHFTAAYRVRYVLGGERILAPRVAYYARLTGGAYAAELCLLHRREPVDVVNFHFVRPHLAAGALARGALRVGCVYSLVGRRDVLRSLPTARRLYARAALSFAHEVLPISLYCLRGFPTLARRATVIPYGVDTEAFRRDAGSPGLRQALGLNQDTFVLLAVQRLAEVKRVDVLIEAAGALAQRGADVALVIVGQGPERDRLAALVRARGLADRVRLVGYVSDQALPSYFSAADVFVCHSLNETFGVVFAQAMAAALPIVAAATSCIPDVLTADNGALVEPFNIAQFVAALVRLQEDRTARLEIGRRNRAHAVGNFDWQRIARRYEEALSSAAHQAKGVRS